MGIREVYKGRNIDEVLELLDKYRNDCRIIAGGTDLVVHLRHKRLNPKVLVDISDIEELHGIKKEGEFIEIKGATTFTEIVKSNLVNKQLIGLKEAAKSVGSPQIRNRGTIGGNICNGSPAADIVPPLLALDSTVLLKSKNKEREISLEELFLDKGKVNLKENELLYSVKFKKINKNQVLSFSKLGLRKALAISRLCISVFLELDKSKECKRVKIADGALGKHGVRERKVEEFLLGKRLNEETIEEGAIILQEEISHRLQGRLSLPFKKEAVKGVFKSAISKALENLH
ncbi:FAD binding domain-containing protein [Thermohalobacter berrensis]|uniref:Xanthine dehydrogenase n=1 Tax=Thermohalobacter berrensis TaxID=99594 RepID=A0A419T2H2_9FIRM|nr:FAD binding domain-containing protein [Thermohalobacter berrensis]RKD31665.1 xanthine dehydrogenase [Thermohalobacter berrensis]